VLVRRGQCCAGSVRSGIGLRRPCLDSPDLRACGPVSTSGLTPHREASDSCGTTKEDLEEAIGAFVDRLMRSEHERTSPDQYPWLWRPLRRDDPYRCGMDQRPTLGALGACRDRRDAATGPEVALRVGVEDRNADVGRRRPWRCSSIRATMTPDRRFRLSICPPADGMDDRGLSDSSDGDVPWWRAHWRRHLVRHSAIHTELGRSRRHAPTTISLGRGSSHRADGPV
jgi:hypothetical protein